MSNTHTHTRYTATHSHTLAQPHRGQHNQRRKHTDTHSHTQTSKHTGTKLRTPLQCTLNMLVSTVVTHNSSTALHTRTQPQSAASSTATLSTQHLYHSVEVAVGWYTTSSTAVKHGHCDMHDHRTRAALVRNMDCQRPPPPPPATHPQHRSLTATHACTQLSGTQKHGQSSANNRKQRCAVTAATARRGAATHT
jgi:hypothetical protein